MMSSGWSNEAGELSPPSPSSNHALLLPSISFFHSE
jgi:hypothetical protein